MLICMTKMGVELQTVEQHAITDALKLRGGRCVSGHATPVARGVTASHPALRATEMSALATPT